MAVVVIASDSAEIQAEVKSVLDRDTEVHEVAAGEDVRRVVADTEPDLVVADLQIGTMGGMAVCQDLRLEESGGRLDHVPVLLLLDRRPDVFLARRVDAEGWLVKPADPMRLRRAVSALLAGGSFHDESYRPAESAAAAETTST